MKIAFKSAKVLDDYLKIKVGHEGVLLAKRTLKHVCHKSFIVFVKALLLVSADASLFILRTDNVFCFLSVSGEYFLSLIFVNICEPRDYVDKRLSTRRTASLISTLYLIFLPFLDTAQTIHMLTPI